MVSAIVVEPLGEIPLVEDLAALSSAAFLALTGIQVLETVDSEAVVSHQERFPLVETNTTKLASEHRKGMARQVKGSPRTPRKSLFGKQLLRWTLVC